jgi:hypothetical protein
VVQQGASRCGGWAGGCLWVVGGKNKMKHNFKNRPKLPDFKGMELLYAEKVEAYLDYLERELREKLEENKTEFENYSEIIEAYMGNYDDVAFAMADLARNKLLKEILGDSE